MFSFIRKEFWGLTCLRDLWRSFACLWVGILCRLLLKSFHHLFFLKLNPFLDIFSYLVIRIYANNFFQKNLSNELRDSEKPRPNFQRVDRRRVGRNRKDLRKSYGLGNSHHRILANYRGLPWLITKPNRAPKFQPMPNRTLPDDN